jgi:hypothetical protein
MMFSSINTVRKKEVQFLQHILSTMPTSVWRLIETLAYIITTPTQDLSATLFARRQRLMSEGSTHAERLLDVLELAVTSVLAYATKHNGIVGATTNGRLLIPLLSDDDGRDPDGDEITLNPRNPPQVEFPITPFGMVIGVEVDA